MMIATAPPSRGSTLAVDRWMPRGRIHTARLAGSSQASAPRRHEGGEGHSQAHWIGITFEIPRPENELDIPGDPKVSPNLVPQGSFLQQLRHGVNRDHALPNAKQQALEGAARLDERGDRGV